MVRHGPLRTVWSWAGQLPIPPVTAPNEQRARALASTEDAVQEGSGTGVSPSSARAGGGWRALLADVRGESSTSVSTLLAALTDASDHGGGWSSPVLDQLWADAHRGEHAPDTALAGSCHLSEVS
jgi:hypothetical protein